MWSAKWLYKVYFGHDRKPGTMVKRTSRRTVSRFIDQRSAKSSYERTSSKSLGMATSLLEEMVVNSLRTVALTHF